LQLSIGPFVQQIIQYEIRSANITAASIPIAISYDGIGCNNAIGTCFDIPLSMKAAVMNAALDIGASIIDFDIAPYCPTGNCTWEPYQSLAVCSKCADLTGQLNGIPTHVHGTPGSAATNWTLSNGIYLVDELFRSSQGLVTMMINNTAQTKIPSVAFANVGSSSPLLDVFIIVGQAYYTDRILDGHLIGPFAAECMLELCVQSYQASEINGIFQEYPLLSPIMLPTPQSYGTSKIFTVTNFPVSFEAGIPLKEFLRDTFTGVILQYDNILPLWPDAVTQAIFTSMNSTPNGIDATMKNIAKSMTRNMRTSIDDGPTVSGQAFTDRTFVRIEWAWMSFPAALLLADLCFLLIVVCQTRAYFIPNWKENVLATLFFGLDMEDKHEYQGLNGSREMDTMAKNLRVKLVADEGGWSLKRA